MKTGNEYLFEKLEKDEVLRHEVASLGWALWLFSPTGINLGYVDEVSLRTLADEIERRNKPFWDEYDQYCKDLDARSEEPFVDEFTFLTDEQVASQSKSYQEYEESVKNSS